jgi:hypothetical protein
MDPRDARSTVFVPLARALQLTGAAQRHADATVMFPKYKSFRIEFRLARRFFPDFPPRFTEFASRRTPPRRPNSEQV